MSSRPVRVRGQDYLSDLDSLSAALKRTQLQCSVLERVPVAFSVGSVFVLVCSSITRQVSITPMGDGLRSSDKEVSEGVYVMAPSAAVTKFLTDWAGAASDEARILLEDESFNGPDHSIVVEVLKKRYERQAQLVQTLMAQVQASTADATAARTQADATLAAQAAHPANSERFKPAPPPKFENKDKDLKIRKWLPVIEEHYEGCPPENYLRLASSHLSGKPRSFYQSKYDAFKASGAVMADPRAFFGDTMLSGYGLKEESQTFWDTWHKLRQVPGEDISEYNSAFEQALTDLSREITDEQVKIEKYKSGLQVDLRELARVAPSGKRWTSLADLISYCTLQWPTIKARLEKKGGFANTTSPASLEAHDTQARLAAEVESGVNSVWATSQNVRSLKFSRDGEICRAE
jgi:hypothetical protein